MITNTINSSKKRAPADILTSIVYLLFIAAHIVVVWALPYFPTQDGPSHIYNLAILHDLLNGGKEWGEYFAYILRFTPNLGFNLIAYPLLSMTSPIITERIFLSFYIVLMGTSVPLLINTFNQFSQPSPAIKFLVFPIIFNFCLMMGFYSYVIAVPVFLLAISMVWRIRAWSTLTRFFCYNIVGSLLFCLHLIPFMFYLIALVAFAVVEQVSIRDTAKSLTRQAAVISPLVILLIFYLLNEYFSAVPNELSLSPFRYNMLVLLINLFTFELISFSPWQLIPVPACLFVLMISFHTIWKKCSFGKRKMLSEQKALLLLVSPLTLIYFALPASFAGGNYFNDRLPWVVFLLLLPLLAGAGAGANHFENAVILIAVLLSLGINIGIFKQQSDDVSSLMDGDAAVCSKGDLMILYKSPPQAWLRVDAILHAPSYYGVLNGCIDIGNYETAFNYFPVYFKKNLASLPLRRDILTNAPLDFSHYKELDTVLGWELKTDMQKKLEGFYGLVFANDKMTMWRRLPSPM